MKNCIIVAAGDFSADNCDKVYTEDSFVISVDGGYKYLKEKGVMVDLALGDFDSLGFVPEEVQTLIFPVKKDKTDMLLAIDEAVSRGFNHAYVFGAFGGKRLDHTIANLQSIAYAQDYIRLIFVDDNSLCFGVQNETVFLDEEGFGRPGDMIISPKLLDTDHLKASYLSIFTFTEAIVSISGCEYNVANTKITGRFPIGISNRVVENRAEITSKGPILIMFSYED